MINTNEMRVEADNLDSYGEPVGLRVARLLRDAADEIDAGRVARLVQYRAAAIAGSARAPWSSTEEMVDACESFAHMMLAAERPVKP